MKVGEVRPEGDTEVAAPFLKIDPGAPAGLGVVAHLACGHEYDGATDTGYCRRCEAGLRDQMEREAVERREMVEE